MKTSDGNNTIKHDLILLAVFILIAGILFLMLSIDSDKGKNTVVVSNKEVYVESADCPDQICVDHAHIMYEGETIVCLPHRLIITIISKEGSETDAISQ